MRTIKLLDILKERKKILSEQLNDVQDKITLLTSEYQIPIANEAIHILEKEFPTISAENIAKILAYGMISSDEKPTIIGVKFDAEEVIVHYKYQS